MNYVNAAMSHFPLELRNNSRICLSHIHNQDIKVMVFLKAALSQLENELLFKTKCAPSVFK